MRRGSRLIEQEEEERRGGEEQATDIKSNNPHLAGGELLPQNQSLSESHITGENYHSMVWLRVVGANLYYSIDNIYIII